jgi:hypothetical protein
MATFEATYALAVPPVTAAWIVDGNTLKSASDTLVVPGKQVRVANAKLNEQTDTKSVKVRYEVEAITNGSRLRLYNQPSDETYDLSVVVTLATAVGAGSAEEFFEFSGREYRYPQRFYDERDACIQRFIDIGDRYVPYKVVLEPDLWRRVQEVDVPWVQQILRMLGHLHDQGDAPAFRQLAEELTRIVRSASLRPVVVSSEERLPLQPQIVAQEPHLKRAPHVGRSGATMPDKIVVLTAGR